MLLRAMAATSSGDRTMAEAELSSIAMSAPCPLVRVRVRVMTGLVGATGLVCGAPSHPDRCVKP